MAEATLTISSRNYSSWSLRGWLLCRMAGLDLAVEVVPGHLAHHLVGKTQSLQHGHRHVAGVVDPQSKQEPVANQPGSATLAT